MRSTFKNILLAFLVILVLLFTGELYFRYFMIQSEGTSFSLISKAWFKKYWKPVNSLGYRDTEHKRESLENKKVIFVVGDSIVAGQGINDYRNRFPDLLQDKLGKKWEVINIAQCGWGTAREYEAIQRYPFIPNIIFISYMMNDILDSAMKKGKKEGFLIRQPGPVSAYFLNHSYLFNYFYIKISLRIKKYKDYNKELLSYFINEEIFQDHKNELLNIIDYAKNHNIKLVFVMMQRNSPVDWYATAKIKEFLSSNDVPVIDMTEKLVYMTGEGWSKEYRVSSLDGHPNEKANKFFAEILFDYISRNFVN